MGRRLPSVILIEFNELTPRLMDRFLREGRLPNFQRLYRESQIYTTDAEEEGENLNPWVQWVTVHSGLSATEHGITRLSEGHKLEARAVWDELSEAGIPVWICGSMNARYDKPLKGCLLPDPWSTGLTPYPSQKFEAYYRFVRHSVQEHTDPNACITKADALRFLAFMATHGLSARTVTAVLKQLWTEKTTGRFCWRRAALLEEFQWDLFASIYRRVKPRFSTFFGNSTAHFQHAHWRNMEPEAFVVQPSEEDQADHRDAIRYGYERMDDLIGRFLRLAGPETTLMFCTGLSQQPFTRCESQGGRRYYRIQSPAVLAERLALSGSYTYHPVMAEQFCLRFAGESEAETAGRELTSFRVEGKRALHFEREDNDLIVQCNITAALPADAMIVRDGDGRTIPFFDVFYETGDLKSGFHHPDGMLWVRTPERRHEVHEEKVSLRSIAPAILETFGLPTPDHMTCPSFFKTLEAAV